MKSQSPFHPSRAKWVEWLLRIWLVAISSTEEAQVQAPNVSKIFYFCYFQISSKYDTWIWLSNSLLPSLFSNEKNASVTVSRKLRTQSMKVIPLHSLRLRQQRARKGILHMAVILISFTPHLHNRWSNVEKCRNKQELWRLKSLIFSFLYMLFIYV